MSVINPHMDLYTVHHTVIHNMVNSVLEGHKGNIITTNKLILIRHQQGQFFVDIVKD